MKTILIGLAAVLGVFVLIVVVLGASLIGQYNTETTLRVDYQAKVDANRGELDNVKKKISQVAQVSQAQLDQLDKLFSDYATARTGSGTADGSLMKWQQEALPNIDQSTFKEIQNVIVGSRDSWTQRQSELVDIARQYNTNLAVFPGNVILPMMGFKHIDPLVITSTATENAFKTGKDDDTNVFGK